MTNNHLLLYRLAELMLEKHQHILALDDLFEDEQIGAFVRSIQIDSPYQQLIFEGVLTETIKEERVTVTFTVEGYFHYVLGEVIEKQTGGKGAEVLKELLENNKLRGITEGVEQCLVRDVEKNDLSRLMWLIDEGGKALEASAYPLAQAFLINPIEKVMDELLADTTDNDIEVLEKAIEKLESAQQNDKVKSLYQYINSMIRPNSVLEAKLFARSIEHIPKEKRIEAHNKLSSLKIKHHNETASDFYYYLGQQLNFIAEYDKAISYYEKSLTISLEIHGDEHSDTGILYNNLGSVWSNKGEYDKAIGYHEKSLAIDLKVHGDQHPSTSISFNNLGTVWRYKAEYDKAIEYFEKSLDIRLKVHGDQHPSTSKSYNNLGIVWSDKGEYDKAIQYYEKALAVRMKVYGDQHPSTSRSFNNLGSVWSDKGEYGKAIEYYEKSLAIDLKVHGDQHPSTSKSYNNLGLVWNKKGEYDIAIQYYEKSLDIRLKVHGDQHPSTAMSYNNMAAVWDDKGEYDKAIEYYEKSLAIDLKVHGEQHPSTATSYNNLGLSWSNKGEYGKAIEYYEKSLAIDLKIHGDQHPSTAICYSNLGIVWEDNGCYDKAIEYYEKSLAIDLKINGEQNSETGLSYFYAADAYLKLKKFKKALDYFKKGFISNQESGGFPFKIAICYENLNQLEEATKNYCLSAEIRKKALDIEDDSTQKAIQEAIRLAKETNNIKLLPDWIKKIANDQ